MDLQDVKLFTWACRDDLSLGEEIIAFDYDMYKIKLLYRKLPPAPQLMYLCVVPVMFNNHQDQFSTKRTHGFLVFDQWKQNRLRYTNNLLDTSVLKLLDMVLFRTFSCISP